VSLCFPFRVAWLTHSFGAYGNNESVILQATGKFLKRKRRISAPFGSQLTSFFLAEFLVLVFDFDVTQQK